MKKALFLFDRNCHTALPWAEANVKCYCVDINPLTKSPHKNITLIKHDMFQPFKIPGNPKDYIFVGAYPPCTHVAVSGARWFKEKGPRKAAEAFTLLANTIDILAEFDCPWFVENPVSTFSTYWRKPDYSFDPCDYAGYKGGENDIYTKRTQLWTNDLFTMPEKKRKEPTKGSKMHLLPPSPDRADLRSATPMGFAQAIFEANFPKKED